MKSFKAATWDPMEGLSSKAYPQIALLGAAGAGDAIHPKNVASGVDLHVVLLWRRSNPNFREIQTTI